MYAKFTSQLIQGLHIPAIVILQTGQIHQCNQHFLNLYQLPNEAFTNNNYFETCEKYQLEPAFKTLEDLIKSPSTSLSCIPNPVSGAKTIQWTSSVIQFENTIDTIFLMGVDISDVINASIREQEIKKSIIDYLPNHYIFWKDINSVYLGCNQALANTMQLTSSFDIIGKTDDDLPTTKEQNAAYRADDREVIRSKTPKLNIEEQQNLPDGSCRELLTSKVPLLDQQNNVYGVLGIYSDITERKTMQLALEQAKQQAEAANSAKSMFITNMSHDIRTPLSGVIGMSHLLTEQLNDPEQQQYARWIHESSEQLLNLLNGVLDIVSANNLSEFDFQPQPCDLRQLIKDIAQLEQPTIALKKLSLHIEIDDIVPKLIITDKTKLHRTLLNLLGNAIKFTEKGSVWIKIHCLSKSPTESLLQFNVMDTGVGIASELQSKIFDRFFRITPSEKGLTTGSGVGLHIAQSYVHLLGGDIKLTSQPGIGTRFYFNLLCQTHIKPKKDLSVEPRYQGHGMKPLKLDPNSPSLLPKKCHHILLIEDNIIAMKIVQVIVTRVGCHFEKAIDGESALKLAKAKTYDLIITDIGLPGISGHEFTHHLREWEASQNRKATPVIGLTANNREIALKEGLASGMNDVLSKPLTLEQMNQIKVIYLNTRV